MQRDCSIFWSWMCRLHCDQLCLRSCRSITGHRDLLYWVQTSQSSPYWGELEWWITFLTIAIPNKVRKCELSGKVSIRCPTDRGNSISRHLRNHPSRCRDILENCIRWRHDTKPPQSIDPFLCRCKWSMSHYCRHPRFLSHRLCGPKKLAQDHLIWLYNWGSPRLNRIQDI